MDCLVFTPDLSPRISYAFKIILEEYLGLEIEITSNRAAYDDFEGIKINYSRERLCSEELLLPSCGLLLESTIRPLEIEIEYFSGVPFFFKLSVPDADFDFDMPALVFFMLTRYEEYWSFESDGHSRFTASQSIAGKYDFLRLPVVNIWCNEIASRIRQKYPDAVLKEQTFHFKPTIDVDLAWAFRNRGIRALGGWIKDMARMDIPNLKARNSARQQMDKDPFYSFNRLRELHKKYDLSPLWFFLMGNYGGIDKSISWKNEEFRDLISFLADESPVGIHPSSASNDDFGLLEKEIFKLGVIRKGVVEKSRQHYLKLSFPDTYRNLLRAGIKEDYSMGFSDDIGFRAGCAFSFPWYDLKAETLTTLRIFPFQVMDVTLKKYLKLSPELAIQEVREIISQIKTHGGTMITLWHNSSFSALHGWQKWDAVYEEIIKAVIE